MTVSAQAFEGEMWDNWGTSKSGPRRCRNTGIQGPRRPARSRLMAIMSCTLMVRIDVPGIPLRTALLNGGSACG